MMFAPNRFHLTYIYLLGRLRLQQHKIFKGLCCNGTMADEIDKTRMRLEICSKDNLNTVDSTQVFFYWIRHSSRVNWRRVQQISFYLTQPVSYLRLVHTYEADVEASEASMCIPFNMKYEAQSVASHSHLHFIHTLEGTRQIVKEENRMLISLTYILFTPQKQK